MLENSELADFENTDTVTSFNSIECGEFQGLRLWHGVGHTTFINIGVILISLPSYIADNQISQYRSEWGIWVIFTIQSKDEERR